MKPDQDIYLYNTLHKQKQRFEPINEDRITMYVCGPTVYNYAHIGNARPPVVFDVLFRLLKMRYSNVIYARNITDIEDKIMKAAAEENVSIEVITERYAQIYREDMGALGVTPPVIEPHATGHVDEMIAMIAKLIDKGFAYESEGHVLFDVTSYEDYGQLSKRSLEQMIAGARVQVESYKRNPGDFVLWKPSTADQPGWDSPWGTGRPGWHIECSAMCEKHLGETIDIHGGGTDLIFPHHENEIAQSVCSHDGKPFARYWIHNGFLTMDKEKMAKSVGNIKTVRELLGEYPAEALRLMLLSAHYRQPLDWSDDAVRQSIQILDRMYLTLDRLSDVEAEEVSAPQALIDALCDDINTPKALSELHALINQANSNNDPAQLAEIKGRILASGKLLGLLEQPPQDWLKGSSDDQGLSDQEIDQLLADRNQARQDKNYAEADRIRDLLTENGIIIEDGAGGSSWRRSR